MSEQCNRWSLIFAKVASVIEGEGEKRDDEEDHVHRFCQKSLAVKKETWRCTIQLIVIEYFIFQLASDNRENWHPVELQRGRSHFSSFIYIKLFWLSFERNGHTRFSAEEKRKRSQSGSKSVSSVGEIFCGNVCM